MLKSFCNTRFPEGVLLPLGMAQLWHGACIRFSFYLTTASIFGKARLLQAINRVMHSALVRGVLPIVHQFDQVVGCTPPAAMDVALNR
jgi:hypothetical protein